MDVLFRTEVCSDGYELMERRPATGDRVEPFLVPKSDRWRVLAPLETRSGVYREFADELTVDQILDLAGKYGTLDRLEPTAPAKGTGLAVPGEPLWIWQNASGRRPTLPTLRDVVRVFELLRDGKKSELQKLVRWRRSDLRLQFDFGKRRGIDLVRSYQIAPSPSAIEEGDVRSVARWFIVQQVNIGMANTASPRLFINDESDQAKVFIQPKSLLGALWMEFALMVEQGAVPTQCVVCGGWFNRLRKDQVYCGSACKMKAFRRARRDAKQS